jgi:hypothetical protein
MEREMEREGKEEGEGERYIQGDLEIVRDSERDRPEARTRPSREHTHTGSVYTTEAYGVVRMAVCAYACPGLIHNLECRPPS